MAIVTPAEPPNARQALADALGFLLNRPGDPTAAALKDAGGTVDQVKATQPHRSYSVGVDDLSQGKLLDAAQPGPWRYLLVSTPPILVAALDVPTDTGGPNPVAWGVGADGSSAFAEAFLATDADGVTPVLTGVGTGPTVAATVTALTELEQSPAAQAADYELRYLEVPAIGFHAVWLHGDAGDVLRPIAPTPTTLADPVAASPDQLLPSLQAAAQAVLDQLAQAPGDSGG